MITFTIYGNSINNEYSVDDTIVVDGNKNVNEGLKGIPKIFQSHYEVANKQSYGYRPIVLSSFALEKQFFKKLPETQSLDEKKRNDKLTQANISHFINVLLYAMLCILLYIILKEIFNKANMLFVLLVTLLFLLHPLHTEIVDSLKNRDELIMLFFMLLSVKFYLNFAKKSSLLSLIIASCFALIARLTKADAMALLGIVPVTLFFCKYSTKNIIISLISILLMLGCFSLISHSLVKGDEIRVIKFYENPLVLKDGLMDRITLGLYCSWFYLKKLIFPENLSFYYGYNQIPMANWSYWQVWVSLIFYISLGVYGIKLFLKRNILGYGIVIWLGLMLGVINIVFPIVGIVADRFAFVFSIGFCIVVVYLLFKIFKIDLTKENGKINITWKFSVVFLLIFSLYSARIVARNPDWHDYLTTYYHDINNVNKSAKAHAMIANTLYIRVLKNPQSPNNKNYVNEIIKHYKKALDIYPNYLTCNSNIGSVYIGITGDYKQGIYYCSRAIAIDNNYLEANFNLAIAYGKINNIDSAFKYYIRVIEINPQYKSVYSVFNNFLITNNMVQQGISNLDSLAKKTNSPKYIYMDIANLYTIGKPKMYYIIKYFEKSYQADTTDKVLCKHIADLYQRIGDIQTANHYYKHCNYTN